MSMGRVLQASGSELEWHSALIRDVQIGIHGSEVRGLRLSKGHGEEMRTQGLWVNYKHPRVREEMCECFMERQQKSNISS